MARELHQIAISKISISKLNSRKDLEAGLEDAGIQELAHSIETNGLLQPPMLRATADGGYEVIAGQRRLLACQSLGMITIDAFVSDMDDDAAVGASLVENLQRADMHPMDKANGFEDLVRRLGSTRDAAKATGLSVQTVKKYLELLKLPETLRMQLGTGNGAAGIGALSTLARTFDDPDEMEEAWDMIKGFKGGIAETILAGSHGDWNVLEDLKDQALRGELGVVRCGSSLLQCPWVEELPLEKQVKMRDLVTEISN